jgi:hypothetical protein
MVFKMPQYVSKYGNICRTSVRCSYECVVPSFYCQDVLCAAIRKQIIVTKMTGEKRRLDTNVTSVQEEEVIKENGRNVCE